MKHTLVVIASNRNVEKKTVAALAQLEARGAARLEVDDINDVSLARNVALSRALSVLLQAPKYDVVLMVDDDMLFAAEQAEQLVAYVRGYRKPASGAYVVGNGMLAAAHYQGDRWQTGLGFLAVHRLQLEQLAIDSRRFRAAKDAADWCFEFTGAGPVTQPDSADLLWEPEDFRFTRRLGGVVLLPISVGHIKRSALAPDGSKLEAFIAKACSA